MWAWKTCTDQSNDSTQFLLLGAKQDGDVLQRTPFAYHKREGVLSKPLQKQEIMQGTLRHHFGNMAIFLKFLVLVCICVALIGEPRHIMSLRVRQTDSGRQALH